MIRGFGLEGALEDAEFENRFSCNEKLPYWLLSYSDEVLDVQFNRFVSS